jgi:hypothetical protein
MAPTRFWESNDLHDIVDETLLGTWFTPPRRIAGVFDGEFAAGRWLHPRPGSEGQAGLSASPTCGCRWLSGA